MGVTCLYPPSADCAPPGLFVRTESIAFLQDEFIKRGLASLEESKRSGVYYSVDESIGKLRAKLEQAKAKAGKA